jgi:DnaJ-class molecular chaperone
MKLLGLIEPEDRSVRSIRAAWARKVRITHPDTAPDVAEAAKSNIETISAARDLLLDLLTGQNATCKTCKGSGKVRGRMGAVDCYACNGTGEKFNA